MKITLLGTGTSQGVPVIGCPCSVCVSNNPLDKRLRVAVLLSVGNHNIVIDCGPDFRQQMLKFEVKTLDAILLTHEHNDHVIGLDDVRPFNFRQGGNMPIYAQKRVNDEIRDRFAYAFTPQPYPGAPQLEQYNINENEHFELLGLTIIPIKIWHGRLAILGFRIGDFAYITDAKTIEPSEIQKLKNLKYLVINALHHNEHHSHFNLHEALAMIEVLQPQQTYLTHISHHLGLAEKINPTLPKNVTLAYDGQVIL
jgi:phosphoribosyl 1,2-cyclic phosphate phosphodiesterase